jgi:hypothetical protein
MAMTRIAPRSSTMARESSSTRRLGGQREPSSARQPTTKAMSVAIGMPQPRAAAVPVVIAMKIAAGTTIPPIAATAGNAARLGSLSSPTASSRFTSRPTTKKKTAISPSLTQWRSECFTTTSPTPIWSGIFQNASKLSARGEFATATATKVAPRSTAPPAASTCMKRASGPAMRSIGATGRIGSGEGSAKGASVFRRAMQPG